MSVKLTRAMLGTLRELASFDGNNRCYWFRPVSCAQLAELGLAETYTPPSVAERPRMKKRPYRITAAGRAALKDTSDDR
ncbi:helix-turn-helix domain-containing protein [Phenylobacterium soli]|uniref:Uncharacterized protein n=1 Tax=Phenylobacterium soli TaxID=2170551 RepID=A0A328AAN0_9CAUL|nr:hypothetical protein [Phenylobacterium soli]RAK51619.1 hypothetical protein DJ017_17440 [Phenylobacterium soli]